jgi:hypothetical protein
MRQYLPCFFSDEGGGEEESVAYLAMVYMLLLSGFLGGRLERGEEEEPPKVKSHRISPFVSESDVVVLALLSLSLLSFIVADCCWEVYEVWRR